MAIDEQAKASLLLKYSRDLGVSHDAELYSCLRCCLRRHSDAPLRSSKPIFKVPNDTGTFSAENSSWSAWPIAGITFLQAFVVTNYIVFAHSLAGCLPSFMEDMHAPEDYIKSLWWLGRNQIVVNTLTAALICAFVGQEMQSSALLSAEPVISRVVFGIALPVIFISGSINTKVVCRLSCPNDQHPRGIGDLVGSYLAFQILTELQLGGLYCRYGCFWMRYLLPPSTHNVLTRISWLFKFSNSDKGDKQAFDVVDKENP